MRDQRTWRPAILLLAMVMPCTALATDNPSVITMHQRLDEARERLDEAARRYADVHATLSIEDLPIETEQRAYLGVLIGDMDEDGVHLVGVSPGGGAADAGVEAGDIMIDINGAPLTGDDSPNEVLRKALRAIEPGSIASVQVTRDGEVMTFDIETDKHPGRRIVRFLHGDDVDWSGSIDDFGKDFGVNIEAIRDRAMSVLDLQTTDSGGRLHLVELNPDLGEYFGASNGVLVVAAADDYPLKGGDIIYEVNGETVEDVSSAYQLLRSDSDDPLTVAIRRGQLDQTIDTEPLKNTFRFFGGKEPRKVIRMRRLSGDDDRIIIRD
ncbi:MAG: PDZ domain-containing protein [Pseudomonadota bacterium]